MAKKKYILQLVMINNGAPQIFSSLRYGRIISHAGGNAAFCAKRETRAGEKRKAPITSPGISNRLNR